VEVKVKPIFLLHLLKTKPTAFVPPNHGYSDYTGKEQCADSELVSFTAYGVDTCFGYGNFSSTTFSAAGNTTSSK
jgi:hypothetical protein